MKFFDRLNCIGRLLVGIYLIFHGLTSFFTDSYDVSEWLKRVVSLVAFIEILGGFTLILGIKPRATAAITALCLLILTLIEWSHSGFLIGWSSPIIHILMGKLAVFGALLFITGTRMIPYGLMIRSEESMNEKYGGKRG